MDYIDIIMPAYNCEEYIENAINTVKKQTYKNWNLIIVNDYSTDGTKKKILENVNEKIQLIDLKSHVGVAEARNVGIKKSKNRYIAFLDADDMWKENKLYEQLKFMKQNEYEFTFTSFSYLKNGKIKRVKRIPSKLNYNQALKNTIILTSTVMIDQAKVKNIKMPKIESEDTATWWSILKQGYTANGLNENLTVYRVHEKGLSFNKIIGIKRVWNLYRKCEGLTYFKTLYCFMNYAMNAVKKRVV